jgi:hypothetical protein
MSLGWANGSPIMMFSCRVRSKPPARVRTLSPLASRAKNMTPFSGDGLIMVTKNRTALGCHDADTASAGTGTAVNVTGRAAKSEHQIRAETIELVIEHQVELAAAEFLPAGLSRGAGSGCGDERTDARAASRLRVVSMEKPRELGQHEKDGG